MPVSLRQPDDHESTRIYPEGDPIGTHEVCKKCGATRWPGEDWKPEASCN